MLYIQTVLSSGPMVGIFAVDAGRNLGREEAYIELFSGELTYTDVIFLVKFSILTLYWCLFNRMNIKIPISILGTGVCMWGFAVVSVILPPSTR